MNLVRSALYTKHTISNWTAIAGMGFRNGLYKTLFQDLRRYPWMKILLRANLLNNKFGRNRDDNYYEATLLVISYVVRGFVDILDDMFLRGDLLIIHEDMVPPEIFRAMGLTPFMAELLGIALPMIDPHAVEQYIDLSENQGVPPDVCSLPKSTMGFVLAGELPPALALVAANLPCDGGMSSYTLIERALKLPTFRLDIPHHFYNDRARTYFTDELRRLIKWMEKHTPGEMDWDKLARICSERNRMVEHELELWDMLKTRPAPLAAEPVYLSHLWGANVSPGKPETTLLFKQLCDLARKNLQAGTGAVKNEKFRALLWNPPLLHAVDLFNWAETAYGVSLIIDSMSYNRREPYIDTSTEESLLYGLGLNIMEGPMARHTRGPAQNYLDDIFDMIKQFNIDMLWVAGHVGCKNTAALNGILREKCREHKLPLLIINYDLSDPRIVSKEGIMEQVNHFMENIMGARRQDA
jgi:benzoyl-CoA reductase/2-hydroxyglutaryl-CoA dehydratase subunit BcrC/BadD/HgdB